MMTTDIDIDCNDTGTTAGGDLIGENMRLRRKLEVSDQIAARYATMLREGDHRIKNSLQIVASLVRLQAGHESNEYARDALYSAATRIQAVGRIHDSLQQGLGSDVVDLGAAVQKMCLALNDMAGDPLGVEVRVDVHEILAPVAMAQPIVLAVNELVVNALRHAFPDDRAGVINVSVHRVGGQMRIVVADNGVGMPVGDGEGKGYGMRLVRMMVSQMEAELFVDTGAGTRITVVAPEPGLDSQPPQPLALPPVLAALDETVAPPPLRRSQLARKSWRADSRG